MTITPLMRQALEAIELQSGIRRGELTATEKRTATGLIKRGLVTRDGPWLITTAAGRQAIGAPIWHNARSLDELDD